ncbi:K01662 1-deoxy-D-xylulose-5-phosphate synthase [Limosilactobacillus fermentum]|uniref:1-deoxy-D-xylulose-5-phosphate synthase n=1 Tax=Limosilactobacillus fermentum TaxID=1613 RepID=A0ABD0ALW9_LIMFE|nr:hypothetical protein LF01B1_12150 [Limosilactobacillus fermentum]CDN25654.1 K01662 1-deoxy-D-xylulose-5-phosphate synthase [Limosilactobacillus fermentum]
MLLEQIHSSKDVKQLTNDQLHTLVDEARAALLQKLSVHGGHNGPNLGVVEMTVALHAVFDSPTDKIIYDVSHQSYVHKMLTGRAQAFLDPAHYDDVSGYTNPKESDDDFFSIGHTSTSLALASGFIKACDVLGNHENIVAVIGDGSLSGGLAYEGLNNVVTENSNAIVIVNDNDQSIAKNPAGGGSTLPCASCGKATARPPRCRPPWPSTAPSQFTRFTPPSYNGRTTNCRMTWP